MNDSLLKRIKEVCEVDEITPEFDLQNNIDSLSRAEIIVSIEEHLGVQLSNKEILSLKTFGDLENLIDAKVSGSGD